jgi:hypothetical protein
MQSRIVEIREPLECRRIGGRLVIFGKAVSRLLHPFWRQECRRDVEFRPHPFRGIFLNFVYKSALYVCLSCIPAFAQQLISVGVKGGVPITAWYADTSYPPVESEFFLFPIRSYNSSKNYVIGAEVELNLPLHLSVEADGLYRPLSLTYDYPPTLLGFASNRVNTDSWEFPILLKYRFAAWKVKPYIDAGPSFRAVGNPGDRFISESGAAVGAGVDFRVLHLRFEPEIRYTYWTPDLRTAAFAHFGSHHNQVEFLIGLLF